MTASHPSNGIVHFDIAGPDDEALRDFYSALFNWELRSPGPGYTLVSTPDGTPDGAIVEDDTAALTVGITVQDLDTALENATAHGGEIVMPPTDNGWVTKAQIADPAGNRITLIKA